jgi:hypothetical protein
MSNQDQDRDRARAQLAKTNLIDQGVLSDVPIIQISKLLSHSLVATTQRHLNLELVLETMASDFVPV